jgi:hypothetical protein
MSLATEASSQYILAVEPGKFSPLIVIVLPTAPVDGDADILTMVFCAYAEEVAKPVRNRVDKIMQAINELISTFLNIAIQLKIINYPLFN